MKIMWKKFNALGTEVTISAVLAPGQEAMLEEAARVVVDFEKKFSRFLVGNELYKFNQFAGGEIAASAMMLGLLGAAQRFNQETDGIFDPTVIGSLEEVGYDRNFNDLDADDRAEASGIDTEKLRRDFLRRPRLSSLKINDGKVIKPAGLRLDFGGLGKGYLADHLADNHFSEIKNYWISIGGDLVIRGRGEGGEIWQVGVQDPNQPERQIFSLKTGGKKIGIATSGIFKRKGRRRGLDWHHLIDPRSGLPADNNILAVTAISENAERADVFAKTVLLLGEPAGLEFIERQTASGCIIFFKDKGAVFSKEALKYI